MAFRSLFAGKAHAKIYKAFRPNYSKELFADIWRLIGPWIDRSDFTVGVDVGCGSGQATEYLNTRFDCVIGVDPSLPQLEEAKIAEICSNNDDFILGSCEHLPLRDKSCNYIQAFVAAHWFNLPTFYKEVDRVLKPGGVLLFGTYTNSDLEPDCNQEICKAVGLEPFKRFNEDFSTLFYFLLEHKCVPEDRMKVVMNLCRDIEMPYPEQIRNFDMKLKEHWTIDRFADYMRTWSGWQLYAKKTGNTAYLDNMVQGWKNSFGDQVLEFTWAFGLIASRKPLS